MPVFALAVLAVIGGILVFLMGMISYEGGICSAGVFKAMMYIAIAIMFGGLALAMANAMFLYVGLHGG